MEVPTLGEFFERYRSTVLSKVSGRTGGGYMVAWRQRVAPTFEHRELTDITTLEVEEAFSSWSGSWSTRIDALAVLSAICRVAVKGGVLASNPCIGVERPRVQQPDPASRALSAAEIGLLLNVLPPSGPYRRFVLALLYTGCRVGEVAGLRVSDIDWDARTIRVVRTASPGFSGELVVGPTKGRRGRTVPLPAPLVPILVEAVADKGPWDLVFPGPRGGYISSKNLSRALNWFDVRDSVKSFPPEEPPLHWHDLRHTAAVMLFLAGLSAPDVQAILSHSTLVVTQQYADTRNEAAKRGAVALSALYARQSEGQLRSPLTPAAGEA
ncbi:site-specific integrase [Rathayibacter sp. AY2B5]|uniref:tyrosine-type recombinase/integrase n=1 Tax=Rathayibacter sp. AY2B5 TaxID=2080570 RepID=UPI0011B0D2A2|nr:site-specific integrase [Rathayibacter sp. AY2B5]